MFYYFEHITPKALKMYSIDSFRSICFCVTNAKIEIIEKAYRYPDDPRKIYFTKLIHHLHPRNYGRISIGPQIDPYATAPPIVINASSEVWECLEDLRQKIRKRCDFPDFDEECRTYIEERLMRNSIRHLLNMEYNTRGYKLIRLYILTCQY